METCPYCNQAVWSVAIHSSVCQVTNPQASGDDKKVAELLEFALRRRLERVRDLAR